jgi:hypothetical protein
MALNEHPAKLFVEVTTLCNLQCGMCVKQNGTGGVPEGSMSRSTFERLAPAFPHLDTLSNGCPAGPASGVLGCFIAFSKQPAMILLHLSCPTYDCCMIY